MAFQHLVVLVQLEYPTGIASEYCKPRLIHKRVLTNDEHCNDLERDHGTGSAHFIFIQLTHY